MADSTKRYVAVDLGASCGKVVLASVAAGTVKTETVHSFPIPSVRYSGRDYWDIHAAYYEVLKGLSMVGSRKLSVESVGIDAWGPGIVCLAADGSFLGLPCIFDEVLSSAAHAKFFKRMDRRELYETTGVNILDSHAALQLFGLRRSRSIALEMARNLLFIPDAMTYLLTGKRMCGYTSLYAAGLVDRTKKKLSRDVLSACKVRPRRFPSVVQPGARPARLSEEVAEATGLGRIPVVAVAGHGLSSAAAAFPAGEGLAFLMSGTVGVLGVETASPVVNDQSFEMNFSNEAGADGTNLLVKRIAGMDLLERCLAAWRAAGRDYGPEDLARMAREGASVAAQLDPEDPALRSAFASPSLDPADAINRYCTLRSMSSPSDDSAIVRLIYSSLAEKTGNTFTKLQSITPFRLKSLFITGEWASDPVLCQMIADECAVPVTAGPVDAAVLGNVRLQAGLTRDALASSFPTVTYTSTL